MYEVLSTLILSYDTVRHCLRHGQIIDQAPLLHANKDIITVNRALSIGRCKSPSLCYVGGYIIYHLLHTSYLRASWTPSCLCNASMNTLYQTLLLSPTACRKQVRNQVTPPLVYIFFHI